MDNFEILESLAEITKQYINQKDSNGQLLVNKYSQVFVYDLVQKHIFDLETIFSDNQKQTIDVFDFIFQMLKFTNQSPEESIYVIIELIDFFKELCYTNYDTTVIKFSDITDYLANNNPKLEDQVQYTIEGKVINTYKLPPPKIFKSQQTKSQRQIRNIDINPPIVLGNLGNDLKRINKQNIYIDSSKTQNQAIVRVHYSPTLYSVMALHQYTHYIQFYYPDCTLDRKIIPKTTQLIGNVIIDICWSEKQMRLAATFKDQWICFWDAADDFNDEKAFSVSQVSNFLGDQQIIYYLTIVDKWITIDQEFRIHFWNLEIEKIEQSVQFNDGLISDITEVPYLQLLCISNKNCLTLWDIINPKMLFKINTEHNRIHQILFFSTYQLILTCGFDVNINIYQIHQEYNDGDLMGQLKGHTSLVSALSCIENTSLIISCDDKHIIKLWDIRTLKCIQTFDLELRQPIGRILNLNNINAICLVSSRIIVCEFENCGVSMSHYKNQKPNNQAKNIKQPHIPIKVEYNAAIYEMYICTRKDLKILDIRTGKFKKIIQGFITQPDDEITTFATLQQHKKIMIGTQKGFIKIHDTQSGEIINQFQSNQAEISAIYFDYSNQLLTTASFDSSIQTWREKSNHIFNSKQREFKFEVLREFTNAHFNQPILLMEVSQYHNLIATATNHSTILIYNAEFSKLSCTLSLENQAEPTALAFVNGFSLLIVADSQGNILIFHLIVDQENLLVTFQARINPFYKKNLEQEDKPQLVKVDSQQSIISPTKSRRRFDFSPLKKYKNKMEEELKSQESPSAEKIQPQKIIKVAKYYTKLLVDLEKSDDKINGFIIAGSNQGQIEIFDISSCLQQQKIRFQEPSHKRYNYNPFRQNREDFSKVIGASKLSHWFLIGNNVVSELVNNAIENKDIKDPPVVENSFQRVSMKISTIQKAIKKMQIPLKLPQISNYPINEIKAHKEQLSYLTFLQFEGENLLSEAVVNQKIISCSYDQFIKILSYQKLEVLGSININHPLPIRWDIQIDVYEILKFKIAFALKIVHFIRKNQANHLSVQQTRMIDPSNMFRHMVKQSQKAHSMEPLKKKENVTLMKDEYTTKDLYYEQIKNIYKTKLQGMSLKQLEGQKKLYQYAEMWKKQQKNEEQSSIIRKQKILLQQEDQQKELKSIFKYLNPDYRSRLLNSDYQQFEQPAPIREYLTKKLDSIVNKQETESEEKKLTQGKSATKISLQSYQNSPNRQKRSSQTIILKNIRSKIDFYKIKLDSKSQDNINKETNSLIQLPQLSLQKKKQQSNFFQYADEHNLTRYGKSNASTTLRQSMKSTQWEFDKEQTNILTQRQQQIKPQYLAKKQLMNKNLGALISDFEKNEKKDVAKIVGVNLMRKTSNSLFNKIVNNLEQKLKKSKYQTLNNQTIYQNSSINDDEQTQFHLNKSIFSQDVFVTSQISKIYEDEQIRDYIKDNTQKPK